MSRLSAFMILFAGLLGCSRQAEVKVTSPTNTPAGPRDESPTISIAPMPREVPPKPEVAPFPHEPAKRESKSEPKINILLPDIEFPIRARAEEPPIKLPKNAFDTRSGEAKKTMLERYGGTKESEKSVELGLAWLAKQQKQDGSWEFDNKEGSKYKVASTGMALLAFLGAGETHKSAKGKYKATVERGLQWLKKSTQLKTGQMSTQMYEHAIGTMAICEAYGMTNDATLKPYAQTAINFVQRSQGVNGSWGYAPASNGDTSITGWQVQSLNTAKLAKLTVDDKIKQNTIKFLDFAAAGKQKSMYGYTSNQGAKAGTALTAVGLWSRACIDAWSSNHPGMLDGTAGLMKNAPVGKGEVKGLYYYYYATQVVRLSEGEDWQTWNEGPKDANDKRAGGMRDWLISGQIRKEGANQGSWDQEVGYIGSQCGRLGTTALCLLNLEVYYRFLPMEKKAADPK